MLYIQFIGYLCNEGGAQVWGMLLESTTVLFNEILYWLIPDPAVLVITNTGIRMTFNECCLRIMNE